MKIRNPFKDYLCRFKDDATKTEKTVWTLVLIYFGYALGHVLVYYIFQRNEKMYKLLIINNLMNHSE